MLPALRRDFANSKVRFPGHSIGFAISKLTLSMRTCQSYHIQPCDGDHNLDRLFRIESRQSAERFAASCRDFLRALGLEAFDDVASFHFSGASPRFSRLSRQCELGGCKSVSHQTKRSQATGPSVVRIPSPRSSSNSQRKTWWKLFRKPRTSRSN